MLPPQKTPKRCGKGSTRLPGSADAAFAAAAVEDEDLGMKSLPIPKGLNKEFLQLRTLKAYRLSGSRSHTTVLGPYTRSVALQPPPPPPSPPSPPSSWDNDLFGPPSLKKNKFTIKYQLNHPALPDVQLLRRLYEAGLIRLLQHLLGVAHETTVLQHALRLEQTVKVLIGFTLCQLSIFLKSMQLFVASCCSGGLQVLHMMAMAARAAWR
ncbi:hypothetical protein EYF80_033858 [Liparis tanakae]|uniref:Uncharacterized protein n=1 Tax=Liparis tanakae TaxID=230148 RepID=A0A4Z2GT66_9TELE|nr:hypothetical protein EYF80_033858 [Liparis tanakae]